MAGAPAVQTVQLAKTFRLRGWLPGRPKGERPALQGVDLEVSPGQVHGIIGPNGSGKTTLLRILATTVLPDSGSARVGAHDVVTDALAVRRLIGFSTGEERSVYWRLSARQNLEFAAALFGIGEPVAAVDAALELVNLDQDADRPVLGYSQGMVRRLALARALIHHPALLLLDEPTRSLDPVATDHFHEVLRRITSEREVTIILTTHDLREAASCCDVVSGLSAGRVVGRVSPSSDAGTQRALRKLVS